MKKHTLICLPYAGSSKVIFKKWPSYFLDDVEIYPIEYAGRGKRFCEPLYQSIQEAILDIMKEIEDIISSEYSIFGYSLGGLLAYEITQKINQQGYRLPKNLIIAACNPPTHKRKGSFYTLDDNNFLDQLKELGGLDEEVIKNPEILELFLPIIKNDFRIVETYMPNEIKKITCAVHCFYGQHDQYVEPEYQDKWGNTTTGHFHLYELPTNHFFIKEYEDYFVKTIADIISKSQ